MSEIDELQNLFWKHEITEKDTKEIISGARLEKEKHTEKSDEKYGKNKSLLHSQQFVSSSRELCEKRGKRFLHFVADFFFHCL